MYDYAECPICGQWEICFVDNDMIELIEEGKTEVYLKCDNCGIDVGMSLEESKQGVCIGLGLLRDEKIYSIGM